MSASDITELFTRDPLSLTNEDITQIIAEFRSRRHLFAQAKRETTSTAAAKAQVKRAQKLAQHSLDLGDLGDKISL